MNFTLNNTFIEELPADKEEKNYRRQVMQAAYSFVTPKKVAHPKLIAYSSEMLKEVGISQEEVQGELFLRIFSGTELLPHTRPYAMCYAGHQFGAWAGQLGDGRAINLAEIEHENNRWVLQLKGAGETPYSRNADGLAVLRSSIREFLCSEAMFFLHVPTTRALSLIATGEQVLRDVFYDGNSKWEPGAVVCRAAKSFLRFGNYELFSARQDYENLKRLTDYTLRYFYPEIKDKTSEKYVLFFEQVCEKTLQMIVEWERVGFVHGVMNTDNMSILGLTIDYGPFGFLDDYSPFWTPNTTDFTSKRYTFGNQASIALWNLTRLANALYPLINHTQPLEAILYQASEKYRKKYRKMMREKLGLMDEFSEDEKLMEDLERALSLAETDFTIFFRKLSDFPKNAPEEYVKIIQECLYSSNKIPQTIQEAWKKWFFSYAERLQKESFTDKERKSKMDAVNPKYIIRNYMYQEAIEKAEQGDYSLIYEFQEMIKNPYSEQPKFERWFVKRPESARNKAGSSMLSCSS